MLIRLQKGLPYVSATLTHRGQQITLHDVLLDTGSAGTIFPTDILATIGLEQEPTDTLRQIRGVSGTAFVFTKTIESVSLNLCPWASCMLAISELRSA